MLCVLCTLCRCIIFYHFFYLVLCLLQVIQLTLLNMFLHVVWCLKSIDFDNPDEAGMSSLVSKRDILIKQLESFAQSTIQSYGQGNARSLLCCTVSQMHAWVLS